MLSVHVTHDSPGVTVSRFCGTAKQYAAKLANALAVDPRSSFGG